MLYTHCMYTLTYSLYSYPQVDCTRIRKRDKVYNNTITRRKQKHRENTSREHREYLTSVHSIKDEPSKCSNYGFN